MTPQQIVAIVIRLASVWLVVGVMQALGMALSISNTGETSYVATKILIFVYLVLAILFWSFPMAVAHFLVPNTKFENKIKLQPYQAVFVACVVLGLWICVIKALPFISTYVSLTMVVLHQGQSLTVIDIVEYRQLFTGIIQLIMGLLLTFKADFLARKIIQLQSDSDKES